MLTKNTNLRVSVRLSNLDHPDHNASWLLADYPDVGEAVQAATEALKAGKADYAYVTQTMKMMVTRSHRKAG